jgi:hypothetical protein
MNLKSNYLAEGFPVPVLIPMLPRVIII